MNTDFLSRWSRRKRGADEAGEPAPQTQAVPSDADGIAPVEISAEAEAVAAPITEEEIAELAERAETLTPESDVLPFLRDGVPQALRNLALRRLWTIDPAIRDAVGDARDYAWDWNTPGGVPVSGPMPAGTDIKAMLRNVFGDSQKPDEPQQERGTPGEPLAPEPPAAQAEAQVQVHPSPAKAEPSFPPLIASDDGSTGESDEVRTAAYGPRGHGSALPV